ncbi:MAG: transposase [Anaerolineae bacterium]
MYFLTCVAQERQPVFANEPNIELLRETMRRVKEIHPFQMRAYAFMHDHLHLMIFVPNETSISRIMHSIQRNFTVNYKKAHGLTESVKMWQHGFWDHVIRDERDFVDHFHYIHYNPVKHGYVSRPEDYPHTSFRIYMEQGWYEFGWGHTELEFLKNLDFE